MRPLLLALLAACAGEPAPPTGDAGGGTGDAGSETDGGDAPVTEDEDDGPPPDEDEDEDEDGGGTDPGGDGLLGMALDPPLDPPVFDVLAVDGTPRTPDWFTGDPSVVWFFRDTGAT